MDEEQLIVWQDVLDQIMAGRPDSLACPYCRNQPMLVERLEHSTRISCQKCGKYIQGRFQDD